MLNGTEHEQNVLVSRLPAWNKKKVCLKYPWLSFTVNGLYPRTNRPNLGLQSLRTETLHIFYSRRTL